MDLVAPTSRFSLEPVGPVGPDDRGLLICASCGRKTDTVPCSMCARNPLLQGRYRLERVLPGDSVGLVYGAADLRRAGRPVTVRVVPVRPEHVGTLRDRHGMWLESFRTLNHPGVRRWLDAFLLGEGRGRAIGIVQRATVLPTLEHTLGRPWDVDQVVEWMVHMLEAVVVLHAAPVPLSCGPLTRARVGRVADGTVQLLHPGGVERYGDRSESGGSEPPELQHGTWTPATDVHRVAGLGIQLLTGSRAAHLVDPTGRWDWSRLDLLDAGTAALLHRWLDPNPDLRPQTAADALDELIHVGLTPPVLEPALTLDPEPEEVPVGVAAVRIPASLQPGAEAPPRSRAAPPVPPEARRTAPRRAPNERRRLAAVTGIELPSEAPDPTRDATRWLTTIVTILIIVASLVLIQIALTATGIVPGSPIIPVDIGPAAQR